ncbi:MAG: EAL domain-containing protein [Limnobacter sp.]|nr:EAL domain-containing protein [Limnobacter sp.]
MIRWKHPVQGLIAPNGFIPLAEQTGLIKDISRWVVCEAYRIAEILMPQQIGLSINISAADLNDSELYNHAQKLHRQHPTLTPMITLEVTESCTIMDPENACDILHKFAALGMSISVDDFGSGYSSLAYLKRFPVKELKIDRSLIQGIHSDIDSAIIVQSTIDMGHTMGLVVTAEGVETEQELERLREFGVDYAQGFWLSRPLSVEEFCARHFIAPQPHVTQPI